MKKCIDVKSVIGGAVPETVPLFKLGEHMDFNRTIFENRMERKAPFLAAHRGICGGNIPCNTLAAYKIAVDQGADVVEIDVTKSKDGVFFVFHPFMEPVLLQGGKLITEMTAEEVKNTPLLNQDKVPTHYRVPTLQEVFAFLKDKAYINVDKFWMDVQGITAEIRKAGVEKQVLVKTPIKEEILKEVETYASDLMFCGIAWHQDEISEQLLKRNINFIGMEALFDQDTDEIISEEYIRWMHEHKLLVWVNSIVYDEKEVISAGYTDDISLTESPDAGWGWLIEKKVDFIQTDWILSLRSYLESRFGKENSQ